MYANPTLYDRSNFLQVRDGAQMIARIKSDFAEKAIDTVLDIGCGTGNLTELINRKLKPKRTIAFDLAPSMIDFARNRRRPSLVGGEEEKEVYQEGVKYYEGSSCEAFDKLAKKLNLKPSSVDVITSFYCIHWVPDKGQACTNIFRFLKPGGRFYMIISVWNELFPVQHRIIHHPYWRPYLIECLRKRLGLGDDEELDESMVANFQVESKPKNDDLQRFWKNHCTIAGLEMNEMTFFYADYPFKSLVDFNSNFDFLLKFYFMSIYCRTGRMCLLLAKLRSRRTASPVS